MLIAVTYLLPKGMQNFFVLFNFLATIFSSQFLLRAKHTFLFAINFIKMRCNHTVFLYLLKNLSAKWIIKRWVAAQGYLFLYPLSFLSLPLFFLEGEKREDNNIVVQKMILCDLLSNKNTYKKCRCWSGVSNLKHKSYK